MKSPEELFLVSIISGLVEYPDRVFIDRTVDGMGVLLSVTVYPSDIGKIIGRGGNIAKAIRTIIRSFGMKQNSRVSVLIVEPNRTTRSSHISIEAVDREIENLIDTN